MWSICSVDVTDHDALRATFEAVTHQFGSVDCLLTAAGIGMGGPLVSYEKAAIDKIIAVNVSKSLAKSAGRALTPLLLADIFPRDDGRLPGRS